MRPSEVSEEDSYAAFARVALPRYGYDAQTPHHLINRSENGTFLITDPDRPAILRVHRTGYHGHQAIVSELGWLDALRADGVVRTPRWIPALDGASVSVLDVDGEQRFAVLFEHLPGVEPEERRLTSDMRTLGAITARMHNHAIGWQRPAGFERFRWDEQTMLGPRPRWGRWQDGIAIGPAELDILQRAEDRILARLAAYGKAPERFNLAHADLRLANLLVDDEEIYVIDFDDCGYGWLLYDLGTAMSFMEHDAQTDTRIESWLAGYQTERALQPADLAEVWTFVMLRRLMLVAWIGSHSSTELAIEMGADYTAGSIEVAQKFLARCPDPTEGAMNHV